MYIFLSKAALKIKSVVNSELGMFRLVWAYNIKQYKQVIISFVFKHKINTQNDIPENLLNWNRHRGFRHKLSYVWKTFAGTIFIVARFVLELLKNMPKTQKLKHLPRCGIAKFKSYAWRTIKKIKIQTLKNCYIIVFEY